MYDVIYNVIIIKLNYGWLYIYFMNLLAFIIVFIENRIEILKYTCVLEV